MSYTLSVCHPNDLLINQWKTVDTVINEKEVYDALSFPVFEVFDGLLLKITNNCNEIYTGIYFQDGWLNLASDSEMNQMFSLTLETEHPPEWSLIRSILECKEPSALLDSIKEWITREEFFHMTAQIVRRLIPYGLNTRLASVLDSIENETIPQSEVELIKQAMTKIKENLPNIVREDNPFLTREYEMYSSVSWLCDMQPRQSLRSLSRYAAYAISTASYTILGHTKDRITTEEIQAYACDAIRENISMFSMLLSLAKSVGTSR